MKNHMQSPKKPALSQIISLVNAKVTNNEKVNNIL